MDKLQLMSQKYFALMNEDRSISKQANDLVDIFLINNFLETSAGSVSEDVMFRKVFIALLPTQSHLLSFTDLRLDTINPNNQENIERIKEGLIELEGKSIVDIDILLKNYFDDIELNVGEDKYSVLSKELLNKSWSYFEKSFDFDLNNVGKPDINECLSLEERRYKKQEKNGELEVKEISVEKVYKFNDVEIEPIPNNAFGVKYSEKKKLPMDSMW